MATPAAGTYQTVSYDFPVKTQNWFKASGHVTTPHCACAVAGHRVNRNSGEIETEA